MNKESSACVAFKQWLPLAVGIVIMSGMVYAAVQQNYRMSANDPQIQIAQDIAAAVSQGTAAPDSIVPPAPTTEMSPSLATFVTIFSATGTPIGSSAALNGKLPTLPSSVFDYVKQHSEDRFTWQPEKNIRIAAVVVKYSGQTSGYILAGRSLKEVEIREKQLTVMAGVGALVALVLTYLAFYLVLVMASRKEVPATEVKSEEPKQPEQK